MRTIRVRSRRRFRTAQRHHPKTQEATSELPTVAEYAERFLEWRSNPNNPGKIVSIDSERSNFKKHILPAFGHMSLDAVTRRDVDHFVRGLQAVMLSGSARNILQKLHVFFEEASFDYEDKLPADFRSPARLPKSRRPKRCPEEKKVGKPYGAEEIRQLCSRTCIEPIYRVRYAFSAMTGCRPGEGSGTRARHLEAPLRENGLWRYRVCEQHQRREGFVERTKTHVIRLVPIHPMLRLLLDQWAVIYPTIYGVPLDGDALLFPARKPTSDTPHLDPMTVGAFRDALRRHLHKLGIPRRRGHDWRYTFASLLNDVDAPDRSIQRMIHTKRKDQTDHYIEVEWRKLCDAVLMIDPPFDLLF